VNVSKVVSWISKTRAYLPWPIHISKQSSHSFIHLSPSRLWSAVGAKLHWRQFGFRDQHSTIDALLRLQRNIYGVMNQRQHLTVLFLDISKAFGRTWHDGLMCKLAKIGVLSNAWRWCRAFLCDRQIRAVHDGEQSRWFNINAGVLQ